VGLLTLVQGPTVLPAQFLTREAWSVIEAADRVCGDHKDNHIVAAVAAAGITVEPVAAPSPAELAARLLRLASAESVVWLSSPQWTAGLIEELAGQVDTLSDAPLVNHLIGAWDPPGSTVLKLVQYLDRLRSPGGCPWDGAQTQRSLVPYLIEETYELVDAIEHGSRADIVEELGDLLMQIVFHARIGEERAVQPFDVDQVAGGICDKLLSRQPRVLGGGDSTDHSGDHGGGPRDPVGEWEAAKAREKPERSSVLDGIPPAMPVLDRAAKIARRLQDNGLDHLMADIGAHPDPDAWSDVGSRLLALVHGAVRNGIDPVAQLREALRAVETEVERVGSRPVDLSPDGPTIATPAGVRA
jgi:XTP/dITP diphosphohydrolase